MANQARTLYGEGSGMDRPNTDQVLDYLRQTAEADEKLRQYTHELVQESVSHALEVHNRFQTHLRDLQLYQGFINCNINHLLNLAGQYEQVSEELQYRLVAMEGMSGDLHRVALSMQEEHERAVNALQDMKGVIETLQMRQAERLRDQQEDRRMPCFVRIVRVLCSLL